MRSVEDIVRVQFEVLGSIELDMERLEEDPLWETIAMKFDLRDQKQKNEAIGEYVRNYLSRESLLEMTPSTNGPATVYGMRADVVQSSNPS